MVIPLLLWGIASALRMPGTFVVRFFAGFCLVANGAYIAFGSFARIGDCGEMLRHGSQLWQLWIFGLITIPTGFWIWNGQGPAFGLASAQGEVDVRAAYVTLIAALLLFAIGLSISGR